MSSKVFKLFHELDDEFKKSLTNIIWYNTKEECINNGVCNMWINMNIPINNDLFYNEFEYLIKIESCNKLGESKTHIGIVETINTSDVTLKCFVLEPDLSFSKHELMYVDIAHITSWYVLSSCYSNLRYDY